MSRPIQIRDVPDEVREGLVAKADAAGPSLSAYLRRVLCVGLRHAGFLAREARRPSVREGLARTGGRTRGVGMADVVRLVRQDRQRGT